MNDSMWNLNFDDFEPNTSPVKIVKQQCEYLEQITEGRVLAEVSRYTNSSTLANLYSLMAASAATAALTGAKIRLGSIGKTTYEFFLTSPVTPNYKFRIMFFSSAVGQYNVDMVLADDIATDIHENKVFSCASEDEFTDALSRIINSKKVRQVIKSLNEMAKQDAVMPS